MRLANFDVGIAGGGVAGLTAACLFAQAGCSVLVIEKGSYPRHKVCGEYLSREVEPLLDFLGLRAEIADLPRIHRLRVTSPNGNEARARLQMGGIGISRHFLDNMLYKRALALGVTVRVDTDVHRIVQSEGQATGELHTDKDIYSARLVLSATGKRSRIDKAQNRNWLTHQGTAWVGIKYHIQPPFDTDAIELHNFQGGYAGTSRVEGGHYCLCYLARQASLSKAGGSIERLEREIMSKNKALAALLEMPRLFNPGVAISQISFAKRPPVEDGIAYLGDGAGLISPLCGNGMAMAMHSALLAHRSYSPFLQGSTALAQAHGAYAAAWQSAFSRRLTVGRAVQSLFGASGPTNAFVGMFSKMPRATTFLAAQTHGAALRI